MTESALRLKDRVATPAALPQVIEPAKMFAAHVRLNKHHGLGGRVTGAALSAAGLMQLELDRDYKSNLY